MTTSRKPEFILLANGRSFSCLSREGGASRSCSDETRSYVGRFVEPGPDGASRLVVFHSDVEPTEETHGDRFKYAIGPFKSPEAARFMARCLEKQMPLITIDDCDRFTCVRPEQVAS
jgi:hypothetical protein